MKMSVEERQKQVGAAQADVANTMANLEKFSQLEEERRKAEAARKEAALARHEAAKQDLATYIEQQELMDASRSTERIKWGEAVGHLGVIGSTEGKPA